jgi:aspartyl aminopeptidase
MERNKVWKNLTENELTELTSLSEDYRKFISRAKTERIFVKEAVKEAEEAGFKPLRTINNPKPGDKFYKTYMKKTMLLGIVGEEPLENGVNILGAHIDSPRMDIKQNPLYEKHDLAYLNTHYYGGIKKYQWVTLPMAIYGVVVKKDGTVIDIAIGDKESDPVFCVTDLLIHLADKQMEKKADQVVEGENLDLLIGGRPLNDIEDEDDKEAVKKNILRILETEYGFEEDDFLSAELEVVPAGEARDMGFDRSMIIGYGQDDRVCAYTSLKAILDSETPKRTAICILTDKEEVGSMGASGAESRFFEDTMAELIDLTSGFDSMVLRKTLRNSCMISSDVSAGVDPLYEDLFDFQNAAFLGRGITFNKYTGARGKSGSNDANAEYIARLRAVLDEDNVGYQTAELGKVDAGGGGTIAYILANYGMNVIDSGVPVLSMHAPWEVTSKADIYEAYRAYKSFLKGMTRIE